MTGTKTDRMVRQRTSLHHPDTLAPAAIPERTVHSGHRKITENSAFRTCSFAMNVPDRQRPDSLLECRDSRQRGAYHHTNFDARVIVPRSGSSTHLPFELHVF